MRTLLLVAVLALLVPRPARATDVERPDTPDAAVDAMEPTANGHGIHGPIPYVIITTRALRHEFLPLAHAHTRDGLRAAVWTLETIRAAFPAGRDDPERIRMFLQDAYRALGARWLLIGGDDARIPMRRATVRLGGPPPFDVIPLPTDQYYACLDGTWNADGDDQWAELADDDVDMIPELIVGRAPVSTRREAERFVARTLEASRDRCHDPGRSVLLIAARLAGGIIDGASSAESLRHLLEQEPGMRFARLYENWPAWPGSLPLTREAAIDSLNRGYDFAVLVGPGEPGLFATHDAPGLTEGITRSDFGDLTNRRKSICYFLSAYTCAPDSLPSIGEALITARRGGAVAVLGATSLQFLGLSDRFMREVFAGAPVGGATTAGEALFRTIIAFSPTSDSGRLTTQGVILFGDPALPLNLPVVTSPIASAQSSPIDPAAPGAETGASRDRTTATGRMFDPGKQIASAPASHDAAEFRSATLEPTLSWQSPNPQAVGEERLELSIPRAFDGAPLEISVFDPAGRRVRALQRDIAKAGRRLILWNMADDAGVPVKAGVYFIGVRMAGRSTTQRVIIVR